MKNIPSEAREPRLLDRPEFIYSVVLFLFALVTVGYAVYRADGPLQLRGWPVALFFLLYGLFTIRMGYDHPRVGYVSFDRVAQLASVLVMGPVDAAWVVGLASLIFPFGRIRKGVTWRAITIAALNNAGLMSLMILSCGTLYSFLGGEIPLRTLDVPELILLPILILTTQGVNEIGMRVHTWFRSRGRSGARMNGFAFALESAAGLVAVLVAIIFNRMELPITILLLTVLSLGMISLRQFARMRMDLEVIVAERTRILLIKTAELERLATRDQLTGLYNRRYSDNYLDGRIEEFHRYHRSFAVALIDLDHFKRINDTFSHEVGDEVLKRVSRVFSARCRQTDMIARYGGEEFLLCFPEADVATVREICEQLRRAVLAENWSDLAEGIQASISVGVIEIRAGMERRELLNEADLKLYAAKNAGRNRVMS
ncbi:MAG: GGDEF domain-containing protein [Gemmatimonadota bacterium]|nr:GGDEF domain-containing protein [Gemmatimonadota bacterium]